MTDLFIRRPVTTTLLMVGLIFFGITAYYSLPVSEMPNIDFPTITVSAALPGADPETMASSVAGPLERQFSSISGLASMSSVNSLGQTQIVLQFALSRNIDAAGTDVQTSIAAASGYLPTGLPSPPTFLKVNPADVPVLYIRLTSPSMPLYQVTSYAKTYMAQRISMVSGVSQVAIFGDQTYAPRIQLDPDKLAAVNLGIDEVANSLTAENVMLPTGTLDGPDKLYTIKADGQLMRAADFSNQVVAFRDGKAIFVHDIGRVVDSTLNNKYASFFNQSQNITLAIRRQPGTNTIEVVDAIKKLLPSIKATLPPAIEMRIAYDRSESIRESISDVKMTLGLAVLLVVLVVYAFLGNLRATIIASLALPAALIGTLAAMKLLGFSLDNLSLMALTLAVGFVVDDAIVMLENIVRHMEMGKKPMQASLEGARQIGFTIISMTLSLAVVFVPIMFMAGILGRILNELAVTITAAIMVSGFVTLTLTPMLCSRFLKGHGQGGEVSGRLFSALEKAYERSLHYALRHRPATMLMAALTLAATFWLFKIIPTGFVPSTDTGFIYGFTVAEQSASFDTMKRRMLEVNRIVKTDPDVNDVVAIVGVGGPNSATNNAGFFTFAKPAKERKSTADEIMARIRAKVSTLPELRAFMFNPPAIQIGGRLTRAMYQFTLLSPEIGSLYPSALKLEAAMRGLKELRDVNSDMQLDGPRINVKIDRAKAGSLGISATAIETALQTAYAARQTTNIYDATDTYKVVVEVEPRFQTDPKLLDKLFVRMDAEKNEDKLKNVLVPVSSVATLSTGLAPITVNHSGQLTSVTISFNTREGYSLREAVDAVYTLAAKELPDNVSYKFEGQATAFEESMNSVPFLLFLAVMVIYIILGILYESFIHPLTILSGLPSAAVGGLIALIVFGKQLDIYGFVGIIMLIGIVKKNAIMVIDFAIEAEKSGKTPAEAVFDGCVTRFRPIMMTTVAAIAGIMPIAVAYGAGGEARQPMGLVVAGGLVISQVVTLYLTPVFYTYMDQLQTWLGAKHGAETEAE
ncbi:MAG: efflux RND transporter permease subunit [Desulfovibrionaceae bacterium]|nr:efflux RND transporter permease subunit [Desulfovibrionaceae bacterium]MBF0512735.1 efflux RND transporter permease subunit [Desulfovibrionaceae bacterium]